ncbi:hypothetical protein Tery_4334 [Trichodesmium erythraeum IMS101]|uniref:Ketol-acid reductoisomerase n=1 Tax=Trichodesmium erythraeum (strain IMS101) TaxID=203124 RepID=Q10WP8_TRIEI|nr:hypothetical protein [Trichodesmium erythraeum GBRTRLIN201]MCH2047165.1 hypothetical protein [Trichodesmium sp. ALOHA_ZT_67]MDE5096525.1 hypothetical protein [Trichodesmium sp. St11_bin5]MDT9338219.1 hypothetical protein [Trichodesmium erythraeum 21-75]
MNKNLILLFFIVAIVFVSFGDSLEFIPEPIQNASFKSRKFAVGLWPDWLKPKNRNERTEEALEKLENPDQTE